MKILFKVSQHRRDFTAVFECEHCGAHQTDSGYDDAYYHERVIPAMRCAECGATSSGPTSSPDVPAGAVL